MSQQATTKEKRSDGTGGQIQIVSPELFAELIESTASQYQQTTNNPLSDFLKEQLSPSLSSNESNMNDAQLMRRRREKEREEYMAKVQRESQRKRVLSQLQQDEQFVQLYNSLIEDRLHVMNDLTHTLSLEAENDERKRQEVYEEWLEKVFNPIQDQIDQQLQSTSIEVIESRRRKLFEEFLEMSNKKPLFRDILLPQDKYNPLEHNEKHSIRYSFNFVHKKKGVEEDMANIKAGMTPSSIERLDVRMWDKMDATPYGHYEKMQKPTVRSKLKVHSRVEFDHYDRPKEVPERPGKRVNYPRGSSKELLKFE